MCTSFDTSPSSSARDGDPGQLPNNLRDVLRSTPPSGTRPRRGRRSRLLQLLLQRRDLAVAQLRRAAGRSAARSARSASARACLEALLELADVAPIASFSTATGPSSRWSARAAPTAQPRSPRAAPTDASSRSFSKDVSSISSWHHAPVDLVDLRRQRVDLDPQREPASSISRSPCRQERSGM